MDIGNDIVGLLDNTTTKDEPLCKNQVWQNLLAFVQKMKNLMGEFNFNSQSAFQQA